MSYLLLLEIQLMESQIIYFYCYEQQEYAHNTSFELIK